MDVTVQRLTVENQNLKATLKKNERLAKSVDSQGMNSGTISPDFTDQLNVSPVRPFKDLNPDRDGTVILSGDESAIIHRSDVLSSPSPEVNDGEIETIKRIDGYS